MKALLVLALVVGCSATTRQDTLGYTLASVTAISAQMTEPNDLIIQEAIRAHAANVPEALVKYRTARDKTKQALIAALDALGEAYKLNDAPSLAKASAAVATLLADWAAVKGAE